MPSSTAPACAGISWAFKPVYLGITFHDREARKLGEELASGARGHDAIVLQRLQQLLDGLQVLRAGSPDALVEVRRHHGAGPVPCVQLQQQASCSMTQQNSKQSAGGNSQAETVIWLPALLCLLCMPQG